MNTILPALSAALVHFVWQGLLLTCLLWMVLRVMRRRSPDARYLVTCFALLLMALAPVATTAVLYSRPAPDGVAMGALRVTESIPVFAGGGNPGAAGLGWVLPAWCAGVLFLSVRLLWGYAQISGLRRRGERPCESMAAMLSGLARRIGLNRAVEVRISPAAESPGVIGWLRPVILVPASAIAGLSPEQFEAVLVHELAHILRYDHLVNALQMLVETLLFYHPCVWWTSARIRRERELCCDDLAVRSCGDAVCYARALTQLEKLRLVTPGLMVGSTGGLLHHRIQRLLGVAAEECGSSKLPVVLGLSFAMACLIFYFGEARAQARPEPQVPAPSTKPVQQPAAARNAPKKSSQPGCTEQELKGDMVMEMRALEHEKKEMRTAMLRLRAQLRFLSETVIPRQPERAADGRMAEVDKVIHRAEARLGALREKLTEAHPEVQAAERELRSLREGRARLEDQIKAEAAADDADRRARAAQIEQASQRLNLEIVGMEAVARAKEQDMRETAARLTAREKACLER